MMEDKSNKKRISIFTLNGYFNYGNRLQLFALSRIIAKCSGSLSVYWPKSIKWKIQEFFRYKTFLKKKYRKEIKIMDFTKKYIPAISRREDYDVAVIGSDQVWNPDFFKHFPYLLKVPGNGKKISYAASIGMTELDSSQVTMFRENLKKFSAVSVREQSAEKLLQPLTNKKIETVLDPTLLLDRSEYEKIEKKPNDIKDNEKYILCYVLGNRDYEIAIEKYAKKFGWRVIYFSDRADSEYGVEEFIYLVHHAQLICTDSFHACVFSFVFERPFVAFERTGKLNYMYTRIQSLIDTFRFEDREFDGNEITEKNLKVDYSKSKLILEKERKKSLQYLYDALGEEY